MQAGTAELVIINSDTNCIFTVLSTDCCTDCPCTYTPELKQSVYLSDSLLIYGML